MQIPQKLLEIDGGPPIENGIYHIEWWSDLIAIQDGGRVEFALSGEFFDKQL